jgi:hypothetical protein
MLEHIIKQLPCVNFLHLPLHRVPYQVVRNLCGCSYLPQILLAEKTLLYLLILLNKVEY